MPRNIPFKVSAKTARLIGRENVSSAEGALAELVKNTYDADAKHCVIGILKKFKSLPERLSLDDFNRLASWGLAPDEHYQLVEGKDSAERIVLSDPEKATELVSNLRELWVVDNGSGMSAKAIDTNWMVIGTNFKENNSVSNDGRVRSGAKGIGRFALDRLGQSCQLFSQSVDPEKRSSAVEWNVDWRDFDDADATLDTVTASIEEGAVGYRNALDKIKEIAAHEIKNQNLEFDENKTGTIIRVRDLHDHWSAKRIEVLRRSLGTLIPPSEQSEFEVFLFDDGLTDEAVQVGSDVTGDFDYKIEASLDSDGIIHIEIDRNELNHSEFSEALFEQEDMQEFPFRKEDLKKRKISYPISADKFLGGESAETLKDIKKIGPFKVTLRFFKLVRANKNDSEKYPYRSYQTGRRKEWLGLFGGVRIYRDNFNVRPYGDPDGPSYDWLSLGQRRASNPAQASRKNWTVSPQNIAGTVTISRQQNPDLNDQSNRGGILDSHEFHMFQQILMGIIRTFERDRSTIHFNLNRLYEIEHQAEKAKAESSKIVDKIKKNPASATTETALTLSEGFEAQQAEIKELKAEQVMLRSLATLGTVLVSFSHEMAHLQTAMSGRSKDLAELLREFISEATFNSVDDAFNPFVVLEDWAIDDKKVKQWFSFALSSVRPERRRRREIDFLEHLAGLKALWMGFLEPKKITFSIEVEHDLKANMLAHEIDIDSIFSNLIVNSYETFNDAKLAGERKIRLNVLSDGPMGVLVEYSDNGPGLDASIVKPNSIFDYSITTKTDNFGVLNGTGLGMWILDTIVRDYGGSARVHKPTEETGFRLDIRLPILKE